MDSLRKGLTALALALSSVVGLLFLVFPHQMVTAAQPGEARGVMVAPRSHIEGKLSAHTVAGYPVVQEYPAPTPLLVVDAPRGYEADVASRIMREQPGLVAEPNWVIQLDDPQDPQEVRAGAAQAGDSEEARPNDPYYSAQWGLESLALPCAWEVITNTSAVKVAVLDTGGPRHPDVPISASRNATTEPSPYDENGHATHVVGIIGATGNNGLGIAGISWRAQIVTIKVLNSTGTGTVADLIRGMDIAREEKARVVNISVGGPQPSSLVEQAIKRYQEAGGLVVAARGNSGTNVPRYPAQYARLSVGAIDPTGQKTSWSSWGGSNFLVAPGEAIFSTYLEGRYTVASGTSMAAPHVTGVSALILAKHPDWSADQVVQQVVASADKDLGPPDLYGYGKVNACRAVEAGESGRG